MKRIVRTPDYPIATTKQGKLHGFKQDKVFHFYGIRYAKAARYEMPEPVEPWDGVKPATAYGYVCPLLPEEPHKEGDPMGAPENSFEMPHVYYPMSENCQYLNVWTRHLMDHSKRPVLVWLHGGGYCTGSSIEIPSYDGHNLADYGDIVVVNLNHRLNVLGFLDLSEFGEGYHMTGILGMADVVAALKWVHENIEAFGGDPGNVTVAGQSGGGGKVAALLQMPEADGLYSKAIIESGSMRADLNGQMPEDILNGTREATAVAAAANTSVLKTKKKWQSIGTKTAELLGLDKSNIDTIKTLPYETIARAATEAAGSLNLPTGMMMLEPSPVNGYYIGRYDQVGFRVETKDVPLIVGTTLGEFTSIRYLGDKDKYTDQEKYELIRNEYGDDTDEILKEFTRIYPGKDILYALSVDTRFRRQMIPMIRSREAFTAVQREKYEKSIGAEPRSTGRSHVYAYMMSLIVPYMGGLALWHCGEIPYVFRNVEMEPMQCTVDESIVSLLQDEVSGAWLRFMYDGRTRNNDLPWQHYTCEDPKMLIIDEKCRIVDESDRKLLELIRRHRPAFLQ